MRYLVVAARPQEYPYLWRYMRFLNRFKWAVLLLWLAVAGVGGWSFTQGTCRFLRRLRDTVRLVLGAASAR